METTADSILKTTFYIFSYILCKNLYFITFLILTVKSTALTSFYRNVRKG